MKNRTMLYLLFFQVIALTLLFPYTPKGEQFDELLARLSQLGMPMILELHEDGSAVLGIFDRAIALEMDTEKMLVFSEGKTMPFFYLNGRLRVQDGARFMIFERRP